MRFDVSVRLISVSRLQGEAIPRLALCDGKNLHPNATTVMFDVLGSRGRAGQDPHRAAGALHGARGGPTCAAASSRARGWVWDPHREPCKARPRLVSCVSTSTPLQRACQTEIARGICATWLVRLPTAAGSGRIVELKPCQPRAAALAGGPQARVAVWQPMDIVSEG